LNGVKLTRKVTGGLNRNELKHVLKENLNINVNVRRSTICPFLIPPSDYLQKINHGLHHARPVLGKEASAMLCEWQAVRCGHTRGPAADDDDDDDGLLI